MNWLVNWQAVKLGFRGDVMEIKTKTVYIYDGQEYPNPVYIKTHIENKIGNIIDNKEGLS